MGDLDLQAASNTWYSGRTRVINSNGTWIGLAVFEGVTSVTDRHATRSVTIGRIYIYAVADCDTA